MYNRDYVLLSTPGNTVGSGMQTFTVRVAGSRHNA